MLADQVFKKLLKEYEFETVLDIGYGDAEQTKGFLAAGKKVTAIDYNPRTEVEGVEIIIGDFMNHRQFSLDTQYDCVWASHVLEHQMNPQKFLQRVSKVAAVGGIIAITVPPMKHQIVGGHLTWWNAGKLLYTLVLSGVDCSGCSIKSYGYNISIILKNTPIQDFDWSVLKYNKHDLKILEPYFPFKINKNAPFFDGDIKELNW